ncbi:MAG: DUF1850 domain-containing protein [Rhizobiaceae bacterium]|nr:DUF1850 domain-containing protein [Rhizobiaceae bacterium]
MSAICLIAAGKATAVAISAFTLSWTHSVQKTEWREDWRLAPAGLQLVEARVKGSGAGMEPPEGSVLKDGWWIYVPALPTLPRLVLASSGATASGWTLCGEAGCNEIGAASGDPIIIEPCE